MWFLCQFFKTENSLTTKVPPTTMKMFCKVINTVQFFSLPYTSEIDIEDTFLYFFFFLFICKLNFQRVPSFGLISKYPWTPTSRMLLEATIQWCCMNKSLLSISILLPATWVASNVSFFQESDPSFLAGPSWKSIPTEKDCKSVMPVDLEATFKHQHMF